LIDTLREIQGSKLAVAGNRHIKSGANPITMPRTTTSDLSLGTNLTDPDFSKLLATAYK
jgi:hypothetical protein